MRKEPWQFVNCPDKMPLPMYQYLFYAVYCTYSDNVKNTIIENRAMMQDQEWLWALFQNGSDETNFFWGHAAPMMDHLTLSYQKY